MSHANKAVAQATSQNPRATSSIAGLRTATAKLVVGLATAIASVVTCVNARTGSPDQLVKSGRMVSEQL